MTFSERLNKAVAAGELTISDLQRWFDRPYATVWTWVHRGYEPRGPAGRRADRFLKLLEWGIDHRRGFPVPADTPEKKRPAYIVKTRHAIERDAKVLASGAPR